MATRNWDATKPLDASTNAAVIGTEITLAKADLEERLMQGGHKFAGLTPPAPGANQTKDGMHCVGYETQTDQTETGYFTLVSSFDGATPYLRAYGSTHATKPLQIEALNNAKFIGPNVTTGLDPGHLHTQGGIIGGRGGTILGTGFIIPSAYRFAKGSGEGTQTPKRFGCRLSVPVTTALVIEVWRHVNPSTSTNVYVVGAADKMATITFATGKYYAETSTITGTLADGDVLVFNVSTLTVGTTVSDPLFDMTLEG
jgi:hypothetical protein